VRNAGSVAATSFTISVELAPARERFSASADDTVVMASAGLKGAARALAPADAALAEGSAFDDCVYAACIVDRAGRFVRVNRRFAALHGMTQEELRGRLEEEQYPPSIAARIADRNRAAFDGPEPLVVEELVLDRVGRRRVVSCRFTLADEAGRPSAVCRVSAPTTAGAKMLAACQQLLAVARPGRTHRLAGPPTRSRPDRTEADRPAEGPDREQADPEAREQAEREAREQAEAAIRCEREARTQADAAAQRENAAAQTERQARLAAETTERAEREARAEAETAAQTEREGRERIEAQARRDLDRAGRLQREQIKLLDERRATAERERDARREAERRAQVLAAESESLRAKHDELESRVERARNLDRRRRREQAETELEKERGARQEAEAALVDERKARALAEAALADSATVVEHPESEIASLEAERRARARPSQDLEAAPSSHDAALSALLATSAAIADATSFRAALRAVLPALGDSLGWDVMVVWQVERQRGHLKCTEVLMRDRAGLEQFETISWRTVLRPGDGHTATVWQSRSPAWLDQLAVNAQCPRERAAAAAGLAHEAIAPIEQSGEVFGVIEAFARDPRERDDVVLDALIAGGQALGTLARLAAEVERPRWRV
jgi:PAS domain S-box-containing protein